MIAIQHLYEPSKPEGEEVDEIAGTIKATAMGLVDRFKKQKPSGIQQRRLAQKYMGLNQNLSSQGRAYG